MILDDKRMIRNDEAMKFICMNIQIFKQLEEFGLYHTVKLGRHRLIFNDELSIKNMPFMHYHLP